MKTITMMQLRASPGEYAFRVRADGESFLVTYQGKPCFKMVPVEDMTIVRPDGTFKGPKPLTFRRRSHTAADGYNDEVAQSRYRIPGVMQWKS